MGTLALIGLGSNLGDRKAILDAAVSSLRETPGVEVRAVSRYHETAPVGGPTSQGAFLNAAMALEVACEPLELLGYLQEIECHAGRVRDVHWGARTLDLDILLFGDRIIGRHPKLSQTEPRPNQPLRVPHAWLPFRRFALAPAAEIAPDAVDPVTGMTIAELLENLDRRPSYVALAGHQGTRMRRLFRRLTSDLAAAGFSNGDPGWDEAEREEANAFLRQLPPEVSVQERMASYPAHIWPERRAAAWNFFGEALRKDRWSEAIWGDRWIVTDFWLDQWWWQHQSALDEYLAIRERVIQPTFVAVIPPWDRDFTAVLFKPADSGQVRIPTLNVGSPLFSYRPPLRPRENGETRDDEFLSPILAACQATRAT
jgi:2-amino-4-hydroxy-6-hydroxymethyldihydropteridine diphosphokinase